MIDHIGIFFRFILFSIPQAIIIIACYKYLRARKTLDAQFMIWGAITTFVSLLPGTFYFYFIDVDDFSSELYELIIVTSNFIGLAGSFLFAFGFLKLIRKYLNQREIEKHDEVDQIGKS